MSAGQAEIPRKVYYMGLNPFLFHRAMVVHP